MASNQDQVNVTAADAPAAVGDGETKKKEKGSVKWFNSAKGFGFIIREADQGAQGEDLFVHQSSIHAQGFRSLQQGEPVEFAVEVGQDGRLRAREVTGPNGGFVQGARRYSVRSTAGRGRGDRTDSSGTGATAGSASSVRAVAPVRFSGSCYHCGMIGHISRNCTAVMAYRLPPPSLFGRGRGARPVGPYVLARTCFNCGDVGHVQRDCPNMR